MEKTVTGVNAWVDKNYVEILYLLGSISFLAEVYSIGSWCFIFGTLVRIIRNNRTV